MNREAVCKLLFWLKLEGEFGGDLQGARAAAAKKRVADADVASGTQSQGTDRSPIGSDAVWCSVGDKTWQQRICEVGVVENVVGLETKFKFQPLGDGSVFEQREVELAEVRSEQ